MSTTISGCSVCGRELGGGAAFQFPAAGGGVWKCLRCGIRHRPMLRRSALVALVVGTVLIAINQGDLLLGGRWVPALWWKIPLTYLVPFLVATYGALGQSLVELDPAGRHGL
jgi:hypothetical protein